VKSLLPFLTASLFVKIVFMVSVAVSDPSRFLTSDTESYHASARALLHAGSFSLSPAQPDLPQVIRTPGYPVFVAAIYGLLGESYPNVILMQIILGTVTTVLVYSIADRFWGSATAFPAGSYTIAGRQLLRLYVPGDDGDAVCHAVDHDGGDRHSVYEDGDVALGA
jgi:4-amino-4-deoxy-L-arabinose transferase-like glycosyltransferase